jgi:hypothetical protein
MRDASLETLGSNGDIMTTCDPSKDGAASKVIVYQSASMVDAIAPECKNC